MTDLTFKEWCASVRDRYEKEFLVAPPKAPSSVDIDSRVQERIMRVGVEASRFNILDSFDDLVVLAHHSLLLDDVKRGRGNLYHRYV